MGTKISALPAAAGITSDDQLPMVETSTVETQRCTFAQLYAATKTLTNTTISLTDNTVTDGSAAQHDIIVHNGTKFLRFAKGSNNRVLVTNNSGAVAYEQVALTTMVTGTLPVANGGTGVASLPGNTTEALINSAGALGAAAGVTMGTNFIGVGSSGNSIASAGNIRTLTEFTLKALTSGGGSNKTLIQFDSSNVLNIGGTSAQTEQAGTTYINASATIYGLIGGTTKTRITSDGFSTYYTANMGLMGNVTSFPDVASGVGVFGFGNCNAAPSGTPAGGGVLYAEGGAGKWKGSSGTVTTFGPAEPHCPTCGRDFAIEHENTRLNERLALCLPCLVDALQTAGVDTKKFTIADKRGSTKADWAALSAGA